MTQDRRTPPSRGRRALDAASAAARSLGDVKAAPHPRWPLGLQAGVAISAPIVIGALIGHAELGFQAATSAFALLYLGGARHIDRARTVPLIGALLLACSALGAAAGASPVATAVGLILIAIVAGAGTQAFAIGPPGPLFFVLVFGSAAHITKATDGVRQVDPVTFVGAAAVGVALAWIIAAAPLVRARHRVAPTPLTELIPGPTWTADGAAVALRVAAVAVAGTLVSVVLVDPDRAYWTVCAGIAVVAMRAPRTAVLSRGLHRVVGTVVGAGEAVRSIDEGERVGVAWLHRTCGTCRWCRAGRENLCPEASFTGWDHDGGYAELLTVPAAYAYPLPADEEALDLAPLLCAGIIGYRALRRANLPPGGVLGIYGFGSSASITAQLAKAAGATVVAITRGERNQALARELEVDFVGGEDAVPPAPLDSAIVFAPVGAILTRALDATMRGGTVVSAGIHMSPIPEIDYDRSLFYERDLRSVTANTRADGAEFLALARNLRLAPAVTTYGFDGVDDALMDLRAGRARGSLVVRMG